MREANAVSGPTECMDLLHLYCELGLCYSMLISLLSSFEQFLCVTSMIFLLWIGNSFHSR